VHFQLTHRVGAGVRIDVRLPHEHKESGLTVTADECIEHLVGAMTLSNVQRRTSKNANPLPPDQDQRDWEEVRADNLDPGLVRVLKETNSTSCKGVTLAFANGTRGSAMRGLSRWAIPKHASRASYLGKDEVNLDENPVQSVEIERVRASR